MKFTKVRSFFKSQEYRRMWFLYIKTAVKNFVSKPFVYIYALFKTIKLFIDYPNSWDRYVKIKEIESKNKKEEEKQAKAIAYSNFIGAIFTFNILLLEYCSYIARGDAKFENYETLCIQFNQAKNDLKERITELEKFGIVIPNELKTIVEDTKIDQFNNFDEYTALSNKINMLCDTVSVTYD